MRLPARTIPSIGLIQNGATGDAIPNRVIVLSLASAQNASAISFFFAGADEMKFAGLSLLATGWLLVLAAIVLLSSATPRAAFALAGSGVETLGLVLTVRAHFGGHRDHE